MNPFVLIKGGGIGGQVFQRELCLKGICSRLDDRSPFPRDKVCGGILQADSWEYLNSAFKIECPVRKINALTQFWGKKKVSTTRFKNEMVYVSRLDLDNALHLQNRSQTPAAGQKIIEVRATGAEDSAGEWIGFKAQYEPVDDVELYYGRHIYLGITPTLGKVSHVAFIVKRNLFKSPEDLIKKIFSEFGLRLEIPLKGTGRIRYGYSSLPLAIGDAKLATHPFLGLGMKHAILSARLLAQMIAENRQSEYNSVHRKIFKKIQGCSAALHGINSSPFRFLLRPLLAPPIFKRVYEWLECPKRLKCGTIKSCTAK